MPRHLVLAALAATTLGAGCAMHRAKSDARRAWLDVSLDDPVDPARVVAFLDSYDSVMVGDRAVVPPSAAEARTWLDNHRREARHWIDEVVTANDRFEPSDLPAATLDELGTQLVGVVLEMGPILADEPLWPDGANPYPWPHGDRELRTSLFGLYLQTGRLCPHASQPIPSCLVPGAEGTVNLPWALAAQLAGEDPSLLDLIRRPAEREIIQAAARR